MSRVLLVGCGKTKAPGPCRAEDLYTGPLFADRRAYAEATNLDWWIISAGYGLLQPDQRVESYDTTPADYSPVNWAGWALHVAQALVDELPDDVVLRDVCVEIHAGEAYCNPLRDLLVALGMSVHLPLQGLGIGEQRGWYASETRLAALQGGAR